MSKAIIILAAGYGTRMKSNISKPMHKIAGKTLISYIIKTALNAKPAEIILVCGEDTQLIQEAKSTFPTIKIAYQYQKLGTGHAVKIGLSYVENYIEEIQIIYGDTPLITSTTLLNLSESLRKFDISFVGFNTIHPANYGRFITEGETLINIIEEVDASPEQKLIQLCNSGIVSAKKSVINKLLDLLDNNNNKQEYYLTKIAFIANQNFLKCGYIITHEEEVLGINSKSELAKVENIKQIALREKLFNEGVIFIAPETVFLCEDTNIGQDTIIHPYVVFGENVKIASNSQIFSFTHIENSTIGSNTKVGPHARLRGKNIIGDNCRIGNFVEIKNSHIESNTKASHLSYLGDSIIGKNVNIGAGTITCNYDGKNKNITNIGDKSFIGSNTSLVAPITIGSNTLIGAGSTITKDVPDDAWAIARSKQIILLEKNKA